MRCLSLSHKIWFTDNCTVNKCGSCGWSTLRTWPDCLKHFLLVCDLFLSTSGLLCSGVGWDGMGMFTFLALAALCTIWQGHRSLIVPALHPVTGWNGSSPEESRGCIWVRYGSHHVWDWVSCGACCSGWTLWTGWARSTIQYFGIFWRW